MVIASRPRYLEYIVCGRRQYQFQGSIQTHSTRLITSLIGDSILRRAEGGCLDEPRYFVEADG